MGLYRVKAGQHIQADPDWEPSEAESIREKETGVPTKPRSKVFKKGQVVESDSDLVARFGVEKFEYLGEEKAAKGAKRAKKGDGEGGMDQAAAEAAHVPPLLNQAEFPGGQVSSGFQVASGSKEGTVSGSMSPEQVKEVIERRAEGNVQGVGVRGVGYDVGEGQRSKAGDKALKETHGGAGDEKRTKK